MGPKLSTMSEVSLIFFKLSPLRAPWCLEFGFTMVLLTCLKLQYVGVLAVWIFEYILVYLVNVIIHAVIHVPKHSTQQRQF